MNNNLNFDRFLAYFSCSAPNSRHSIGVSVAEDNNPFGPYTDPLGVPLIYHNEVILKQMDCNHNAPFI